MSVQYTDHKLAILYGELEVFCLRTKNGFVNMNDFISRFDAKIRKRAAIQKTAWCQEHRGEREGERLLTCRQLAVAVLDSLEILLAQRCIEMNSDDDEAICFTTNGSRNL